MVTTGLKKKMYTDLPSLNTKSLGKIKNILDVSRTSLDNTAYMYLLLISLTRTLTQKEITEIRRKGFLLSIWLERDQIHRL